MTCFCAFAGTPVVPLHRNTCLTHPNAMNAGKKQWLFEGKPIRAAGCRLFCQIRRIHLHYFKSLLAVLEIGLGDFALSIVLLLFRGLI